MIFHKGIAIKFLVLVLLLCMEYDFLFVSGEVRCIEKEREALLRFKLGLIDYYGVLPSWGTEDARKECCNWEGVVCSNTTGHVVALLLDDFILGGQINSALLEMHHLNNLDLSGNYFEGSRIPEFIGSMKQLLHLNLRNSYFSGIIPPQLGNLTNLRTLDLSYNPYLRSDNLNWLSSLSLLSRLNLSYSNLSDTNWLQPILKLHSLQELCLRDCKIADVIPSEGLFVNSSSTSTSLSILDLSYNQLTSFDWLFNLSTSLVKIDLSNNQLDGPIPDTFGRLNFLEYLDLFYNKLEGEIPKSLGNLSHLQFLSLSFNDLGGPLEGLIGNVSCKVMVSLESVALSYNQFTGPVPDVRACAKLRRISLGNNKLTGPVPVSLGEHTKLEVLDVSFNSLEGTISEANFMKLHNLKILDLSFNSLTLHISPDWSPPFQLDAINLACCSMGPHFPKWIQTQRNFVWLDLASAGISDEVPKWLWSLSPNVRYLNISHNQISGTIPDFSSNFIQEIDVSSNKISGPIPLFHPNTSAVLFSQNMFSGSIASICTIPHTMLEWLDLSNNQLIGELPNCWENMTNSLMYINMANNSFFGVIPPALGSLRYLRTLHLRDNNLSGELPPTLKNCQFLQLLDIGGNKLTGNITWIGANYTHMRYLSLHDNRFYGSIPSEICHLSHIHVLDLSRNNLSGKIPECFDNFTSMGEKNTTPILVGMFSYFSYSMQISTASTFRVNFEDAFVQWKGKEAEYRRTLELLKLIDLSSNRLVGSIPGSFSSLKGLISLNLSRNSLTGNIIPDIDQMEMLECLDLSRNQISGEIPSSLAQLHYLAVLDLANNNLSGKIPSSTQLQSFDASAYAGNNELCGRPLTLCPEDGRSPSITNQGENIKEKDDGFIMGLSFMQEFGISMFFGFFFGFWGVVCSLVLKKSWRREYFNFLDAVGDWLCVTTTIFLSKFRRS